MKKEIEPSQNSGRGSIPYTRDLSVDILRIFAMLFIIIHYCVINNFGLQGMVKGNNGGVFQFTGGYIYILVLVNALVIMGANIFFLHLVIAVCDFRERKFLDLW